MGAGLSARGISRVQRSLAIGFAFSLVPITVLAQTPESVVDSIKQMQTEIRGIQKHYEMEMRQLEQRHRSEMLKLQRQLDELRAAKAPKPEPAFSSPTTAAPAALSYAPADLAPAPAVGQPPAAAALPPPPQAALPPPVSAEAKRGGFMNTGIELTLGGFLEGAMIYRSRNLTADIGSPWNTIPFPNSPNDHLSEFRFTGRQTRLSLLAQGRVDADTALAGYVESDFLSAPTDANGVESNSYSPRVRHAYATLDRSDLGLHILGGQDWTFLTLFNHGLRPRQERVPLTIDNQLVPGFTWVRQPQFRVVQDLDSMTSIGLSLESPQASVFSGPNAPLVPTTFGNPGGLHLNPLATYSTDIAPDIVAKAAYDPDGWGHYEAYGIGRLFRSRAGFKNDTVWGGGGGLAAVYPLIPNQLEVQGQFLAGYGLGRYGPGLLPDVTLKASGVLAPIPEIQAMVGLVGHPIDTLDLYLYAGIEDAGRTAFTLAGKAFGYGNALYNNSGCLVEGSSLCAANTSRLWQVTGGPWYRLYKGEYGTLQLGAQLSYTRRNIFSGIGGAPSTDDLMVFTSLRYLPF
jgi:hypothetical protein